MISGEKVKVEVNESGGRVGVLSGGDDGDDGGRRRVMKFI